MMKARGLSSLLNMFDYYFLFKQIPHPKCYDNVEAIEQ